MLSERITSSKRKPILWISGLALALKLAGLGSSAVGQESTPVLSPNGDPFGVLEKQRFVGTMKAEGDDTPDKDVFIFSDGTFKSKGCLEWGFSPAPYWVRRDANGIHFLSELTSPEHGTIRYEGVFDGKKLRGIAAWKKERWYWTLERDYLFEGKPSGIAH
jgi:hypothetical protein